MASPSATPATNSTAASSFLMEEYKALRKEIEIRLTESRALEQYTALAVGAIWAWQIQRKSDNYLVWAIPIVISVLSFLRRLAMNRYFQIVRAYLMKVEDAFGVKGWEHEERRWNIGSTETIFHCIIILLSIAGLVMSPILVVR